MNEYPNKFANYEMSLSIQVLGNFIHLSDQTFKVYFRFKINFLSSLVSRNVINDGKFANGLLTKC